MIGGTQDNGTHRYSGDPAWELSDGGDGGFTAIDPSIPTRMYHEYVGTTFYRSDSAGAPGTWALKNSGITGGPSFMLHSSSILQTRTFAIFEATSSGAVQPQLLA